MIWRMVASITWGSALATAMMSLIFSGMIPGSRVIRADAGFVLAYPLAVLDCTKARAYHMPLKTIRLTLIAITIITIRSQLSWISRSNLIKSRGVMRVSGLRIVGDATVYQSHLLVGVIADIALVRYDNNCASLGIQLGEQLQHRRSRGLVQITGRFVSHQDGGIVS